MRPIVNVVLPSSGNFAIFKEDADHLVKKSILFHCSDCGGYHVTPTFSRTDFERTIYMLVAAHAEVIAGNAAPIKAEEPAPVEDPKAKAEAALNGVLEDIAKRTVAFSQECQADLIKAAEDAVSGGLEPMSVMEILERAKQREIEKEKPPLTPPAGAIFLAQVFADIASRAPRA